MSTDTWSPVRLSAMHHRQVELGAVMVERDGWQQAARYTSVDQELERLHQAAGLCDVSATGKLSLQGDALDKLLGGAFSGEALPDIGEVRYHTLPDDVGGPPLTVARLAADEAAVLTRPDQTAAVADVLDQGLEACAHVVDTSSAFAAVQVTGPVGHLLIASLTELDVSPAALPNMRCAEAKAAEIYAMLLRMDLRGLASYVLCFGREYGEYMWDALLEAGQEYGASPVGFEAMGRLE